MGLNYCSVFFTVCFSSLSPTVFYWCHLPQGIKMQPNRFSDDLTGTFHFLWPRERPVPSGSVNSNRDASWSSHKQRRACEQTQRPVILHITDKKTKHFYYFSIASSLGCISRFITKLKISTIYIFTIISETTYFQCSSKIEVFSIPNKIIKTLKCNKIVDDQS